MLALDSSDHLRSIHCWRLSLEVDIATAVTISGGGVHGEPSRNRGPHHDGHHVGWRVICRAGRPVTIFRIRNGALRISTLELATFAKSSKVAADYS